MIPQLEHLADLIAAFPGVGKKSAMRIALFFISQPPQFVSEFTNALGELHANIGFCPQCGALTQTSADCQYCGEDRDSSLLCVVEQPSDLFAIEKTGEYSGRYHVLMGALSPLDGIAPEDLRLKELFQRIKEGSYSEIIVATNPSVEGNATASYIASHCGFIKEGLTISRIASGMAMGSQLEYTDTGIISQSFRSRAPINLDT